MHADETAHRAGSQRSAVVCSFVFAAVLLLPVPFLVPSRPPMIPSPSSGPLAASGSVSLPGLAGSFVENRGQVRNAEVRYYIAAGGLLVGLVPSGLLIVMPGAGAATPGARSAMPADAAPGAEDSATPAEASAFRVAFEGSNVVVPQGRGELAFRSHYLAGRGASLGPTGVPSYREVVYANLYAGIDLVYRVGETGLKYEFVVRPGADPRRVHWSYAGVLGLEIRDGALVVRTATGEVRDAAPVAFQEGRSVPCAYAVDGRSVGLACNAWDPRRTLTVDPLLYSTFLGGSQDSRAVAVAVDASGDAYVAGYTFSVDFPTTLGAFRTTAPGPWDVFVVKMNPSGTAAVYATFLGGSGSDRAFGIAVDAAGDAFVTGYTNSTDFPTTPGVLRTTFASTGMEAFVSKLNPAGSALVYSTFLGGSSDDRAYAIALDGAGEAFVTGRTKSADFPVTAGAFDPTFPNTVCGIVICSHGFVAKLSADGSRLAYASFLGGSLSDRGLGITVDASGSAFVTGYTNSSDFQVTAGAYATVFHAGGCGTFTCSEAYVSKVNPNGTALVYSTFLGGAKTDQAHEIAVAADGSAVVTGDTNSTDFPVTPGAFETRDPGPVNPHAFVARLDPAGATLVYSTFLGGSGSDYGSAVTLDPSGNAYVVGRTNSSDFPVTPGAYDVAFGGGSLHDVFVSELNAAGTQLLYSTYLGGALDDWANGVALDGSARVYVVGHTTSADFPTTPGAYRTSPVGRAQAFVLKLSLDLLPTVKITSPAAGAVATSSVTMTGVATRATSVQVRIGGGVWANAIGVASWTATLDLSSVPVGSVLLEARAWNGTMESAHDSVSVQKTATALILDRCTVSPAVLAIQVGGTQAFAAIGWNGTTQIAGVSATWSVGGSVGTITSAGMFTATAAGSGSVGAAVTYGVRSATCAASVTVTTSPPPTVAIASPASGSNVTTDVIVVRGTSAAADAVQVRAGSGAWSDVVGNLAAWSASLDMSGFPAFQSVTIEARAFNGTVESTHDLITVFRALILVVAIANPLERAQVSGTLAVTGTATQGSIVQVRFDGGAWVNVSVSGTAWAYAIDTTSTYDGGHIIEARAVLGTASSASVSRDFVVSNSKPIWEILSQPLLIGLVILILFALILFLAATRRRKRDDGSEKVPPPRTPPR